MKHTKEEIMNALQIIKDECTDCLSGNKFPGCKLCPMYRPSSDNCAFDDMAPHSWAFGKDDVWRAFL